MSIKDNNFFKSTVDTIFNSQQQVLGEAGTTTKIGAKSKAKKPELELALAVLLVDLASCDQNFDPKEYAVIQNSLVGLFGTSKEQVQQLVNQANLVLANMRGVNKFADLLKDNLTDDEKHAIFNIIEDVIKADGQEDGFEVYLREKFKTLLGI